MHIYTSYYTLTAGGGVSRFLQLLVPELAKYGHEITIYAPQEARKAPTNGVQLIKIPRLWLPRKLSLPIFLLLVFLCSFFSRNLKSGPVVAQGSLYALALLPLKWRGHQIVTIVHGNILKELSYSKLGKLLLPLANILDRIGINQSAQIITFSQSLAAHILATTSTTKPIHVTKQLLPTIPPTPPNAVIALKQQLNIKGETVLLFVGKLQPIKRVDILLQATAALKNRFPLRLIVVGSGPCAKKLKQLAEKLEITALVNFVGWQDQPHLYMKLAQLLIIPSDYENAPFALMEALQLGLVVIGSDSGSMAEHLNDSRLVFPAGDWQGLATTITAVLDKEGRLRPEISASWQKLRTTYTANSSEQLIQILTHEYGQSAPADS